MPLHRECHRRNNAHEFLVVTRRPPDHGHWRACTRTPEVVPVSDVKREQNQDSERCQKLMGGTASLKLKYYGRGGIHTQRVAVSRPVGTRSSESAVLRCKAYY